MEASPPSSEGEAARGPNGAGMRRRGVAYVIDAAVYFVFLVYTFFVFAEGLPELPDVDEIAGQGPQVKFGDSIYVILSGPKEVLFYASLVLGGFAYFFVLQGLTGRTLGKAAMGLRTASERGERPPGVKGMVVSRTRVIAERSAGRRDFDAQ